LAQFDIFNPTDEHRSLRSTVQRFAESQLDPQAADHDRRAQFNDQLFRRLATELGLFGLTIPESDGGAGMDATASVIVHEELSRHDPGLILSYLAHEVLFVHNFYHSSNEQQRDRFLAKVIDGTFIAGMAMTEPECGTDVLGMRTRAVRDGDNYIVNGIKQFITNAPQGDIFLVYAKTGDSPRNISAFVVERTSPGFSSGPAESKLGMRASPTGSIVFENMIIPASNLLGNEGGAMVHMMRNLEIERLTLAAQSIGIARRCCDVMTKYAVSERRAFGEYLCEFGQIQRLISESFASTQAARALVYSTALNVTPDRRESLDAAASKLIATVTGETVARNAIQVLGGYGYSSDCPLERLFRDSVLLSIGGGTNEAMQRNITRDLARQYR